MTEESKNHLIDVPADLHFEDEDGSVLAWVSGAVRPEAVTAGAVLVAGALGRPSCATVRRHLTARQPFVRFATGGLRSPASASQFTISLIVVILSA